MKRKQTEVINFADFMSGDYKRKPSESLAVRFVNHVEEHKFVYGVAGMSVLITIIGAPDMTTLAVGADAVPTAGLGIDEKARELYFGKFMDLAKWFIIGKGGFDTVNKTVKEDFDGAKKSFVQYLVIYVLLLGLPWSLDQVETIFVSS